MSKKFTTKMPDDLKRKVANLTALDVRYLEYRARGQKQSDAALKAGSEGGTRESLGRIGYNIEQKDGAKQFMEWMIEQKAIAALVDSDEVIDKLRTAYEMAMSNDRFNEAIKAAELLGKAINLFDNNKVAKGIASTLSEGGKNGEKEKMNLDKVKEEYGHDELPIKERLQRLKLLSED